ncbi:hypothetical protein [Microcoleus sp. herbarium14]|uniref:hypothetical protein n=1 Tax=Microcoleus sp. herbarium14 TaxID=3055439 RepID=UPI002FD1C91F
MIRTFAIIVFCVPAVWDVVTTYKGIVSILGGENSGTMGVAIVLAIFIAGLSVLTTNIWNGKPEVHKKKSNFSIVINGKEYHLDLGMSTILRLMWLLAIPFDFWTSLTGNIQLLTRGSFGIAAAAASTPTPTGSQWIVILFATAIATLSPMIVGHFLSSSDNF